MISPGLGTTKLQIHEPKLNMHGKPENVAATNKTWGGDVGDNIKEFVAQSRHLELQKDVNHAMAVVEDVEDHPSVVVVL